MNERLSFDAIVRAVGSVFDQQHDPRKQTQVRYQLSDAGLGAFAVFFTQSPSFLAFQRDLARRKGTSNCHTLFDMITVPTDAHIRNLLDGIDATSLQVVFRHVIHELHAAGNLQRFEVSDAHYLVALDGTEYHSSTAIHCPNCSQHQRSHGDVRYSHTVIAPVLVAPNQAEVISLEPEFVLPQDGTLKQDSELAAAKRWVTLKAPHYPLMNVIVLADDLYSHQPFCDLLVHQGWHFVLVCKHDSHPTLTSYLALAAITTSHRSRWTGGYREQSEYRYVSDVPLRDGEDALHVNWCEVRVTREDTGEVLYYNSFVTDLALTESRVVEVIAWGRSRWKTENENHNVLKTKGYHFAHNYGHGQRHLSTVLLSLLLLAFLTHTVLALTEPKYQAIRKALGARKTFFDDVRALLRYQRFSSWTELLDFMLDGLEIRRDDPRLDTS